MTLSTVLNVLILKNYCGCCLNLSVYLYSPSLIVACLATTIAQFIIICGICLLSFCAVMRISKTVSLGAFFIDAIAPTSYTVCSVILCDWMRVITLSI